MLQSEACREIVAIMAMEDPVRLLRRLRLGREEYCQRLLTMLILGGPYPPWNTSNAPSDRGARFLRELDTLSFGMTAWDALPLFVDEFDLPARRYEEQGGAPDYAVLWPERLWMIELKTETASHRREQLPGYLTLAGHHHPTRRIDLTYLTPPMPHAPPITGERARFHHLTWAQVVPLITDVWGDGDDAEQRAVDLLLAALDSIGTDWNSWRTAQLAHDLPDLADPQTETAIADTQPPADPFREAMALAEATARDCRQRALDHAATSLEELQRLRLSLREAIRTLSDLSPIRHVQPWIWNATTSGGTALTTSGAETGYELRLSRYGKPVC